MGNEELKQNQDSDHEKQSDPSKPSSSELHHNVKFPESTSYPDNTSSKEIKELQHQLQRVQQQLAAYQSETPDKEKRGTEELARIKGLLNERAKALEKVNVELAEKQQAIDIKNIEFKALKEKCTHLEEELTRCRANFREKIGEKTEETINFEVELKETKNLLTTAQTTIETLQTERETYLNQINKLQDVLQQTEEEIKEIEEGHLEVQDQLHKEISRTEERAGLMREDLKRETRGNLARDRHIRVVLQQSELGRILLYLVDYFENTKKKSLALGTLSTEVGIAPIICRTHLRHLHELAVCNFNEVSREISLIKRLNNSNYVI